MNNELLLSMLKHYGIKEIYGTQHNPFIVDMFKEIGYAWVKDDETAWCSASLNYFCERLGYERSGKLDARSWLKVGTEVKEPEIGDVVVFWRNKPDSWEGHVGLFISKSDGMVFTLGGNQGDMLCINPYNESKVLGYRRLQKI
jgi:uncharacterized protein (TIGR02594 family)